jgi:hypothetical protein
MGEAEAISTSLTAFNVALRFASASRGKRRRRTIVGACVNEGQRIRGRPSTRGSRKVNVSRGISNPGPWCGRDKLAARCQRPADRRISTIDAEKAN